MSAQTDRSVLKRWGGFSGMVIGLFLSWGAIEIMSNIATYTDRYGIQEIRSWGPPLSAIISVTITVGCILAGITIGEKIDDTKKIMYEEYQERYPDET